MQFPGMEYAGEGAQECPSQSEEEEKIVAQVRGADETEETG